MQSILIYMIRFGNRIRNASERIICQRIRQYTQVTNVGLIGEMAELVMAPG